MYLPVALLVATLVSCQAFADKVDADVPNVDAKNGGELVRFLQKFKWTMHTGDPKTGVPRLDPYFRRVVNINLSDSVSIRGKLWDVSAIGFSKYVVKKGDFSKDQLTANVSLLWDKISIRTNYNFSGEVFNDTAVWGRGFIGVVIRDLKVTVNTKLAEMNGKMAVSSLSSHLHLNKFYFKIIGFRDSVDESNKLTQTITNSTSQWIEDHQKEVSRINNRYVTDVLNKYLGHFTLNELMKVIEV